MNKRRFSYGLLVTLAAALIGGCDSTPPAETPAQPTAAPADTGAPAPTQTAAAEPPPAETAKPAEPPPPPPKPAKEKFIGKFTQDFSGDVADAAGATAQKAGGAKKDQKKIDASLEKQKKAFMDAGSSIEVVGGTITWTLKGKAAHTIDFEVAKGDDPSNLSVKFNKDNKKPIKGGAKEVSITFKDDSTFEMVDPFAAKDPKKLVFKK
jgi:plastocyanin